MAVCIFHMICWPRPACFFAAQTLTWMVLLSTSRPSPIEVTRNDTLRVHAFNGLDKPTSLHHHGMFFRNVSYFDGAVGVTQW